MNICIECKHHKVAYEYGVVRTDCCTIHSRTDPVTGDTLYYKCSDRRSRGSSCGPEGKEYEPKEPCDGNTATT